MMNRFQMSDIDKTANIHFIGIGGISMSGLAQIVLKDGYGVSGSDSVSYTHLTLPTILLV